jgi:hypothetical protein
MLGEVDSVGLFVFCDRLVEINQSATNDESPTPSVRTEPIRKQIVAPLLVVAAEPRMTDADPDFGERRVVGPHAAMIARCDQTDRFGGHREDHTTAIRSSK